MDECQSEGLRSDFNDNKANHLVKNQPTLMEIFTKLRRKLTKGKDTSLGDIDDISNDSGSQQEDLDFLINHGHLQTVLHSMRPNYASSAMNRLRFRDGD